MNITKMIVFSIKETVHTVKRTVRKAESFKSFKNCHLRVIGL